MRKGFRLFALVAVLALVAGACRQEEAPPAGDESPTGEPIQIGLVYDIGGRGDLSFNDAAAAGLDQASGEFNLEVRELEPNQGGTNRGELLRLLAEQGFPLIIGVGFLFAADICATAL